ncbi:WD40/YVTN repeat-like-containing domain,WD40-repeat-containing domain,WD40 repeat [Cinara cedri]|uniref:WD40/YVTN repeat-like-containing domain,WD40-repeat-containing domain,WD40 repeat n=1 Tax=Cinara cedri TaxID=506608 RepID=A0A5E4MNA4_9HEMI|nr:WD40/YVTN repeat-like-containing domain,WD40-repeat-containing domain,WD40 repeat [Cinara cedri]
MFSDSPVVVVGFNHADTNIKGKSEVSFQHNGLYTEDKICETINVHTIATQTDEVDCINIGTIDFVAVKNCLERGLRFLKTECNDSWPNIADYFETTDKDINYDEIITLSLSQNPLFRIKKIGALCWNSNGQKLLVASGENCHISLCNHLNSIFIYSLSDLENGQNNMFDKLEVTFCVTCLASHPTNEYLIAAGLYNGEILIHNMHDMTSVSLEWHSQAVSELLWFVKSDHQIILTSAGRDGYICVGSMMSDKIKFTQQLCRYLIGVQEKIGIRCFDYSNKHFIVALENGEISSHLCEISKNIKETVKVKTYNGCSLIIENVQFCHTNNNKFIVTQYDCKILLYDLHQKDPIKIVFNRNIITSLCWNLKNDFIVYIGEETGELAKVNLVTGKTDTVKRIASCNLISMNINPTSRKNIAFGTTEGEIYISNYE